MGLRSAIDQRCKSCIHDPKLPGNWRQQVTWCNVTECALFEVRPRSRSARQPPKNGQNGRFLERTP